jgi:hypothetical protein
MLFLVLSAISIIFQEWKMLTKKYGFHLGDRYHPLDEQTRTIEKTHKSWSDMDKEHVAWTKHKFQANEG